MNHTLLMMGGSGTRFGTSIPKQFIEIEGRPIFSYIMDAYDRFPLNDSIVLVCHEKWIDYATSWAKKLTITKFVDCVAGGSCRSESVRCGLRRLAKYVQDDDIIMIHDATHPYFDAAATTEALRAAEELGGATLGQKQYDTVYVAEKDDMLAQAIPRETIISGASPELFRFALLHDIYESLSIKELEHYRSVGALALANNIPMRAISTEFVNLKITYKHDMELFEKLFHGYYF